MPVAVGTVAQFPGGSTPLAIVTKNLWFATIGVSVNWQLHATGGAGNYSWAVTTPFSPAVGLSVTSGGRVVGVPNQIVNGSTTPTAVTFGVTCTDGAGTAVTQSYSIAIYPQPFLTYDAPVTNAVLADPIPPPAMGAMNSSTVDDISGFRVLRATDATQPDFGNNAVDKDYVCNTGNTLNRRWSCLGNYFCYMDMGTFNYFAHFDKVNFTVTRLSPGGTLGRAWDMFVWHPTIDTQAIGLVGNRITSLDVVSGATAILWDVNALATQYGVSTRIPCFADNSNMAVMLGNQDSGPGRIAVNLQGVVHVFDIAGGMMDGVAIPGWVVPNNTAIHDFRMDQSGRVVMIEMSGGGGTGGGNFFWNTDEWPVNYNTAGVYHIQSTTAPEYVMGHHNTRWDRYVNSTYLTFLNQWRLRGTLNLSQLQSGVFLQGAAPPGPTGTGGEVYAGWENGRENMQVPFILTNNGAYSSWSPIAAAYQRELSAWSTDADAYASNVTTWRLCHVFAFPNPAGALDFYGAGVVGQVTMQGDYILFQSRWGNTLLTSTGAASQRQDLFIVELKSVVRLTSLILPNAQIGTAYSTQLAATGGTAPYTYTLKETHAASGNTWALSTAGLLTGTPGTATNVTGPYGDYFIVQVTDSSTPTARVGRAQVTLITTPVTGPPVIAATVLNATLNAPFTATLSASGGTPPYTWAQTGIPYWLTLNATTGALTGTPPTSPPAGTLPALGYFTFLAGVTDSASATALAQIKLNIALPPGLSIFTRNLRTATLNIPFSEQLQAQGGSGNYSWAVTTPFSPAIGLSLSSSGLLSGTPNQLVNGSQTTTQCTFGVTVTDTTTNATATRSYSIITLAQPKLGYTAPRDFNVHPEPAGGGSPANVTGSGLATPRTGIVPPTMGPRNSIITDDISGYRILRLTEGAIGAGQSITQGGSEKSNFSLFSNYIGVGNAGAFFFQLNKVNFQATSLNRPTTGNVDWGIGPDLIWDPVIETRVWTQGPFRDGHFWYTDVTTGVQTAFYNYAGFVASLYTDPNNRYVGYPNVADNYNIGFMAGQQDRCSTFVAVVQGVQHILDMQYGTIDGVAIPNYSLIAGPGSTMPWPTGHQCSLEDSGRYLRIVCNGNNVWTYNNAHQPTLFWDLYAPIAQAVIVCAGASPPWNMQDHDTSQQIEFLNNNFTIRSYVDTTGVLNVNAMQPPPAPGTQRDIFAASAPSGTQMSRNASGYMSWQNQRAGMHVPALRTQSGPGMDDGTAFPNQTFYFVARVAEREMMMYSTDPAAPGWWRICHNFAFSNIYGTSFNFWDNAFCTVSRDGSYLVFSSNWGNTLSTPSSGGQFRVDCFVVEML